MVGRVGPGALDLVEAARFDNVPVRVGNTLHWDILRLYADVIDGLRSATEQVQITSVGVDSWGVDYGLLDADGVLLGNPVHYRDRRTDGMMAKVLATVPAAELYEVTGIQLLPINTIFQLTAALGSAQLAAARTLLLIPDLIAYWLTGVIGAELTNASTTQLLDARSQDWSEALMTRLGIDPGLLPGIRRPGDPAGELRPDVLEATGLAGPVAFTAVATHDTASAVVGVPAAGPRFAYISAGTWSLVGVELDRPVLTPDSMAANFTNEIGVDGTIRYLRNVMGLWLLQESLRTWQRSGSTRNLAALLSEAARLPALASVIDPDDPVFLPPGDMPSRISQACQSRGQPVPATAAETTRCILDSIALAHRRALDDARRLSGKDVEVIHLVGGGARNELLCQLTADACGLPVEAGPIEATAFGNVLVQARALGAVGGDLAAMRGLLRTTQPIRTYEPQGDRRRWDEAARRVAT
jgi:rhamnulokinase